MTLTLPAFTGVPDILFPEFMDAGGNWDEIGKDFAERIDQSAPEGVDATAWAADFHSCGAASDPVARLAAVRAWLVAKYPDVMRLFESSDEWEAVFVEGVASAL